MNSRDRRSEEFEMIDLAPDKFGSLPEIRGKSKTTDSNPALAEEKLHSFSSKKLIVNAYRKI
jgi:hypothetical protein